MNIENQSSYQLDFQQIRKKTQNTDFQSLELYLINIFNDLSRREFSEIPRKEKCIEKITFIEYMNIPYIVGEKLFNVFDTNKNGFLNQVEFVSGIINLYSGGLEETQKVIFDLLDFDFDGKIIPEDSRLLISFIKNLANAPNGILKKIKPRNTLTDDEDLEEINIIIRNFFGEHIVMNFKEFKNQIEKENSDVFFLFICFLYNNKPYHDSSIRVLKQSNKNSTNLNTSRNSIVNNSFDNSFKAEIKARIRSPSRIFKSFITELVDVDLDEMEKSAIEDNLVDENDKSDFEDYNNLISEDCDVKAIPNIKIKIELHKYKNEKDYIRSNTNNKKKFGSTLIRNSYKNFMERLQDKKSSNTLKNKENMLMNNNLLEICEISKYNYNYTFNNNENVVEKTQRSNIDIDSFKKSITPSCNSMVFTSGKKISDNELNQTSINKASFREKDGTGGSPEKADFKNYNNNRENQNTNNLNKSLTDLTSIINYKNNRISKKYATNEESTIYPKIEISVQNNLLETNLSKNDLYQSKISNTKLSKFSLDNKDNTNISNNPINNKYPDVSSGKLNKYLCPDSTIISSHADMFNSEIRFEGYIYRSDENNQLKKYYACLVGSDLFYFSNSRKSTLKGIHNLSGTYIFKDPHVIRVKEEYFNTSTKTVNQNSLSINPNESKNSYPNTTNLSKFSTNMHSDLNKNSVLADKSASNLYINKNNTVFYYAFKLYFKLKCRIYYCSSEDEVKNWVENVRCVSKYREVTDHYIFGKDLGHGKFGKVKLGYPRKNLIYNKEKILNEESKEQMEEASNEEEKIAIKIISKVNLKSLELELVKSEIEIMKFCRFKNIVKIIENFEDHENIYIILEYLSGGNLNSFLSSQKTLLTESQIKKLILQIASGINYLHHFGIIHRDLKPENIMMTDKSEHAIVKIVDFGLSKVLGISEKSNDAYGTLAYAAPEVIKKVFYGKSVDIWSLGVILYFLISGQFPFSDKNNNMHKIAVEITSGELKFSGSNWKRAHDYARDLVAKCLERDVNKRIDITSFIKHKWFRK